MSFWEGPHRDFYDAADGYFAALEQAGIPEAESSRAVNAWASYGEALQEVSPTPERYQTAADAYETYAETIRELWSADGRADRAADAYRTYLEAIRELWGTIDPERLEPASLVALAQSVLGVGWTAGLTNTTVDGG